MDQDFPPAKPAARAPSAKKGRAPKDAVAAPPAPRVDALAKTIEVIERYFDLNGRPIERKSLGAARVARRYDRRGNQLEESYYNSCGKPTERRDLGAASIAWRYDEKGRRLGVEFFSADGALIGREEPDKPNTLDSVE